MIIFHSSHPHDHDQRQTSLSPVRKYGNERAVCNTRVSGFCRRPYQRVRTHLFLEPRLSDVENIAVLFSGGGASIANMDALLSVGLKPANYTEYSGNPPREKVYQLTKIVLSKPGLRGLWVAGGVANFTDVAETFAGIIQALDEIKPSYPIVVRRAGPKEEEGMKLMKECATRNNLKMKLFGKDASMSETAKVLAKMVNIA